MARAATKGKTKPATRQAGKPRKPAKPRAGRKDTRPWGPWAAALVLAMLALRLAVNALELVPVHFDEAQYWAYGQELAWGYFSKPPGSAALLRLSTDLLGDTLFGLRVITPLAHAAVAWLIFATGRRLWDGQTGFLAAAGYTLAPGVSASAMIVSTDPPMMAAWAIALYAWVRAAEGGGLKWWALMGLALGLGMLTKYTVLAFAGGALGYGLFSARHREWRGPALAAGVGVLTFAPNLAWNAANSFATVAHVAEDAGGDGSSFDPVKFAEFLGAQFGVIGPVFLVAIGLALWHRRQWLDDWGMRMTAWLTAPLLAAMLALALVTRAQPNWAAPAYVAGTLLAARWVIMQDWHRAYRWGQLGLGAVAALGLWAVAALYDASSLDLPRGPDPFKKMRIAEPFCERALGAMAEEGAEVLLSDNRRRLSECMFLGGLGWDSVAIWNPDQLIENHHELVASLYPGDQRLMLLAVLGDGHALADAFDAAREVDAGELRTHGDRVYRYSLWSVQGFKGYD